MYPPLLTSSSQLPCRQSLLPNSDKSYCVHAYKVVRAASLPRNNLVGFNPKAATFHAVFTCRLFQAPRNICTQLQVAWFLFHSFIQLKLLTGTLPFISFREQQECQLVSYLCETISTWLLYFTTSYNILICWLLHIKIIVEKMWKQTCKVFSIESSLRKPKITRSSDWRSPDFNSKYIDFVAAKFINFDYIFFVLWYLYVDWQMMRYINPWKLRSSKVWRTVDWLREHKNNKSQSHVVDWLIERHIDRLDNQPRPVGWLTNLPIDWLIERPTPWQMYLQSGKRLNAILEWNRVLNEPKYPRYYKKYNFEFSNLNLNPYL